MKPKLNGSAQKKAKKKMPNRFIMLVGIAGSGKSTWAQHPIINGEEIKAVVVSSDAIREGLYGDASIQTNPAAVFDVMNARALTLLLHGQSVIYDATNLRAKNRKEMLDKVRAIAPDCETICIFFETHIAECQERQSLRDRKVPFEVIERQARQFELPQYQEGWSKILRIS